MAHITVTITDITKGPFQLSALFTGSQLGATVTPAVPNLVPKREASLTIQNDPNNGGGTVYYGDNNTRNDGTCQGVTLPQGASVEKDLLVSAAEKVTNIYLHASANGAVINVEVS